MILKQWGYLKDQVNQWKNKADEWHRKANQWQNKATQYAKQVGNLNKHLQTAKNKAETLVNNANYYHKKADEWLDEAVKKATKNYELTEEAKKFVKDNANLEKHLNSAKKWGQDQADWAEESVKALADSVKEVNKLRKKLTDEAQKSLKELTDLKTWQEKAEKMFKENILVPLLEQVGFEESDINTIGDIITSVVDSTVDEIKKLNVLPKGLDFAEYLKETVLQFMSTDFCVPYNCIAGTLGLDNLKDIPLYKSEKGTIKTSLTPKTCLEVTDVELDVKLLTSFLDQFCGIPVFHEIFKKSP